MVGFTNTANASCEKSNQEIQQSSAVDAGRQVTVQGDLRQIDGDLWNVANLHIHGANGGLPEGEKKRMNVNYFLHLDLFLID